MKNVEEKGQPQGIAPTFKYLKISGSVLNKSPSK